MADDEEPSMNLQAAPRDYAAEHRTAVSGMDHKLATLHPFGSQAAPAASAESKTPAAEDGTQKAVTGDGDPLSSDGRQIAFDDPLSSGMLLQGGDFDPLGAMGGGGVPTAPTAPTPEPAAPSSTPSSAATAAASAGDSKTSDPIENNESAKHWKAARQQILRDYSFVGKIRVHASFMTDVDEAALATSDAGRKLPTDKAQARLERLERKENDEVGKMEVSVKEYVQRIEMLHKQLDMAWKQCERVQSLKIAIKCAKLLQDTSVIKFYPTMFIMLTEILDTFGRLVYERIHERARAIAKQDSMEPIGATFSAADVPRGAKETCRNWFYKTACIRELVPRLFIELSICRCYAFLEDNVFSKVLTRLSGIIRGIGDPLLAGWARVYLARVGGTACPDRKDYLLSAASDYMFTWQQIQEPKDPEAEDDGSDGATAADGGGEEDSKQQSSSLDGVPSHHRLYLRHHGIDQNEYVHLHQPALAWIMGELGTMASKEDFKLILKFYRDFCSDGVALRAILDGFDPTFWAQSARGVMQLIKMTRLGAVNQTDLLGSLGRGLLTVHPPASQRVAILNDAWKIVTKDDDLPRYAACAAVWLELTLQCYQEKHVLTLLKDIVKHIRQSEDGETARIVTQLESIVGSITRFGSTTGTFSGVLTSSYFMQILDLFKSDRKTELLKELLVMFTSRKEKTSDPVIIHTVFDIARGLHDSLDRLSPEDERRQIAELLCLFVGQIDFGNDLEQQLNVLVDCRAAFPNLNQVKDRLVLAVADLAAKAHRLMRGKLTRKTTSFIKACLAYCHITTPSIDDPMLRLKLFLRCGQLALVCALLPQTDTLYKAAISVIPEVPEYMVRNYKRVSTEPELLHVLKGFLSSLIVLPGHPVHGPFYLVKGLLKAAEKYPWRDGKGAKIELYIQLIPILAAYTQRKLPYCIPNVDSNDVLYGGHAPYIAECNRYMSTILDAIMGQLGEFGREASDNSAAKRRMAELVLDLVNQLIAHVQFQSHVPLVLRFLKLARKNGAAKLPYYNATLEYVQLRAAESDATAALRGQQAIASRDAFQALAREL